MLQSTSALPGCSLGIEAQSTGLAFVTRVGGSLRTRGVAVVRPGRSAVDLDGLDLDLLAAAAAGVPRAAAKGKLVILGEEGIAIFQTKPGFHPELVWCGNGSSVIALLVNRAHVCFDMFGPNGKVVRVVQALTNVSVRQVWTLPGISAIEAEWQGRPVVRCSGLNTYAVVVGPLPENITPGDARRLLAGEGLAAKLVVVTPSANGVPHVAFHNAHGLHGAVPGTGISMLSILARQSPLIGGIFSGGAVTCGTKADTIEVPLPDISIEPDGAISVVMPTVDVQLLPLLTGDR